MPSFSRGIAFRIGVSRGTSSFAGASRSMGASWLGIVMFPDSGNDESQSLIRDSRIVSSWADIAASCSWPTLLVSCSSASRLARRVSSQPFGGRTPFMILPVPGK